MRKYYNCVQKLNYIVIYESYYWYIHEKNINAKNTFELPCSNI